MVSLSRGDRAGGLGKPSGLEFAGQTSTEKRDTQRQSSRELQRFAFEYSVESRSGHTYKDTTTDSFSFHL